MEYSFSVNDANKTHQEKSYSLHQMRVKALLVNGSITRLLRTKNYYNGNATDDKDIGRKLI
jgi:hypothetical protein